jgi:hypothetical protein
VTRATSVLAAAAAWLFGSAEPAAAQDASRTGTLAEVTQQPTGTAEIGLGWVILPGAEVCVEREVAGCHRGDSSPVIEAWQILRADSRLAAGAGLMLGLIPTTDAPRVDPEGIERDHQRRYFAAEATARYYPYVGDDIEIWTGLMLGLVVVSDYFATQPTVVDDRSLVGARGVTIRTEGLVAGLGMGLGYRLAPHWLVGASLRYSSWFLPGSPATDTLGDEASLVGRNSAIAIGVNLAYRIAL